MTEVHIDIYHDAAAAEVARQATVDAGFNAMLSPQADHLWIEKISDDGSGAPYTPPADHGNPNPPFWVLIRWD